MNKLRWILRAITICCLVIPIVTVVLVYRDDFVGMVVPSQIRKLIEDISSISSKTENGTKLDSINKTISQLGIDPNKLQVPQIENLTYNNQTGVANVTLNFANPMANTTLDVDSFSLDVADSNGSQLFTIQLDKGIDIGAGQTGDIMLSGIALNDNAKVIVNNLLSGKDVEELNINDFQLSNLNADVGGITVHIDKVDTSEILGGFLSGIQR